MHAGEIMLNKVMLIGNLGKDPEIRYTQSGDAVTTLTVATSETWKDKDGQKQESTEWHRVIAWRKLAEICGEYLKKGSKVYIEGKLQTRKWQDQNGNDKFTTEIIASNMQMLSPKGGAGDNSSYGGSGGGSQEQSYQEPPSGMMGGGSRDDVPF